MRGRQHRGPRPGQAERLCVPSCWCTSVQANVTGADFGGAEPFSSSSAPPDPWTRHHLDVAVLWEYRQWGGFVSFASPAHRLVTVVWPCRVLTMGDQGCLPTLGVRYGIQSNLVPGRG